MSSSPIEDGKQLADTARACKGTQRPPLKAGRDEGRYDGTSSTEHIINRLQERKYFDSGDYILAKVSASEASTLAGGGAARSPLLMVGRLHPSPERMPHSNSSCSLGRSPMKDNLVSSSDHLCTVAENNDDGDDDDARQQATEERKDKRSAREPNPFAT